MSNIYADAIYEFEKNRFSHREVVITIIAHNPSAYLAAVERIQKNSSDIAWKDECLDLMRSGLKIEAIKRCREVTGLGLHEAKKAVEELYT